MEYWPFRDPFWPLTSSRLTVQDRTKSFRPEEGVPITRSRVTARVDMWTVDLLLNSYQQFQEFETWFDTNLSGGSKSFLWRRPQDAEVRLFKITPAVYDTAFPGGPNVRLSFPVMVLPGRVWSAPYMADNSAQPPAFVADYAADRYWIGQTEVAATDLDAVTGSYIVRRKIGEYTITERLETFSGDVPQTAPSGVQWLAGFSL